MKNNTVIVENERLGCWGFYPTEVANDLECEVVFSDGSRQRLRVYESVDLASEKGKGADLTLDEATLECLVHLQVFLELAINAVIAAHESTKKRTRKAA